MSVLWVVVVVLALFVGYVIQFSSVTLQFGKTLAGTESGSGFQDAITPPWYTNLALAVYVSSAVAIGAMWWYLGWASGLGAAALIVVGSLLSKLLLPKRSSTHYKKLILQSMCSRYADYVRDGDSMRAQAMKELLDRAGLDPDARTRT